MDFRWCLICMVALVGCDAIKKDETASPTATATPVPAEPQTLSVAGTLNLDTPMEGATVTMFTIDTPGVELKEITGQEATTSATGSFKLEFTTNPDLPEQSLMLKAVKDPVALAHVGADHDHSPSAHLVLDHHHSAEEYASKTVMWSYAYEFEGDLVININIFSSIAYDVALVLEDLSNKGIIAGEKLTKQMFAIEENLITLDKDFQKSIDLSKVLKTLSQKSKTGIGAIVIILAKDLSDEVIDGKMVDKVLTVGDNEYPLTEFIPEIKKVAAGETPDFARLEAL